MLSLLRKVKNEKNATKTKVLNIGIRKKRNHIFFVLTIPLTPSVGAKYSYGESRWGFEYDNVLSDFINDQSHEVIPLEGDEARMKRSWLFGARPSLIAKYDQEQ